MVSDAISYYATTDIELISLKVSTTRYMEHIPNSQVFIVKLLLLLRYANYSNARRGNNQRLLENVAHYGNSGVAFSSFNDNKA